MSVLARYVTTAEVVYAQIVCSDERLAALRETCRISFFPLSGQRQIGCRHRFRYIQIPSEEDVFLSGNSRSEDRCTVLDCVLAIIATQLTAVSVPSEDITITCVTVFNITATVSVDGYSLR